MSPLPKRKKTPEELAALRESLGISPEGGPPPGAPGVAATPEEPESGSVPEPEPKPKPIPKAKPAEPAPVPPGEEAIAVEPAKELESTEEQEEAIVLGKEVEKLDEVAEPPAKPEEPKPRPVRSLRKSERLPVDRPKKAVARNSGELPVRRHSDDELARLRHQPPAATAAPPAVQLQKLGVGWPALVAIYGLGGLLMLAAWAGALSQKVSRIDLPFDWLRAAVVREDYRTILFGVMAAGVAVMLLGAAWIYFKKPRSQHHSAIMTIIAVLVLVFGTLYLFPGLHGA